MLEFMNFGVYPFIHTRIIQKEGHVLLVFFFCFLLFLYHANLYDMHRARNNSRVLQRRAFKLCTKSRSLQTLSNHKYKYKILKIISKLMMYIIRINCLEINIGNIHLLSPCLP